MGVISFGDKVVPLGVELSGIVRRVGSNVRSVAVGDRVLAVAFDGCFTTKALILAPLAVKIPDEMSFEEAATMPGCFVTAVQSLIDIGQLEKGQVSAILSLASPIFLSRGMLPIRKNAYNHVRGYDDIKLFRTKRRLVRSVLVAFLSLTFV